MQQTDIVTITANELDALRGLSIQTFSEAYSGLNTTENMVSYVKEQFSEEKLKQEFDTAGTEFYFAMNAGKAIGYLKVNFKQPDNASQEDQALEVERIYVLKAYQGKGVGQSLFEKAMEVAAQKGANYVWLGVWDQNRGAIRFYERNGFVTFDQHSFKLGDELQNDLLMRKLL